MTDCLGILTGHQKYMEKKLEKHFWDLMGL
jgi:hypothetical protein